MVTVTPDAGAPDNLGKLLERLGAVPPERVRMRPFPGAATEEDLLAAEREPRKRLCELVDRVLVEKPMGARESLLASLLVLLIGPFARAKKLGRVLGEGGMLRLFPGLVRIPDVSFISRRQLGGRKFPDRPLPDLFPDLAVEVLSRGNTREEMKRKLREYFRSGAAPSGSSTRRPGRRGSTPLPKTSGGSARSSRSTGGDVLPGFSLPLKTLFELADEEFPV
jgi:hypothetical protein